MYFFCTVLPLYLYQCWVNKDLIWYIVCRLFFLIMLRKAYLIMPLHWLFNYPCFEITLSNMYKYIDMMKLLSLKEDHASQRSMIWILYWIVGWLLHINVCTMHSPRKTFAQTYVLEMQFLAKALYMNSVSSQSGHLPDN